MMCIILVLLFHLVTSETTPAPVHQSVYFLKENEYYITQSKWLVHFVLDFQTYEELLLSIQKKTFDVQMILQETEHKNDDSSNTTGFQARTARYIKAEIHRVSLVKSHIDQLKAQISNLRLITGQNRSKRSWFPFMGNIVSHLFGTVTSDQLNHVQKKLQELSQSQEDINHVIQDSISLINITRLELQENRKLMNHIVDVVDQVQANLISNQNDLLNIIFNEKRFRDHHFQITFFISNLELILSSMHHQIINLEMQINAVTRHTFNPTVMSPQELSRLLKSVYMSLPSTLKLPYEITSDLFKYYQSLPVSAFPMDRGLFVLLSIPILDIRSKYEVFKILNIDVPYPNTNLTARIDIPQKYMAISGDRSTVTFLDHTEFAKCSLSDTVFCAMMTPLYPVLVLKDYCVMDLFLTRKFNENKCQIQVFTIASTIPKLYHIQEAKWVITTAHPITLHVNCPDGESWRINVNPPLAMIQVHNGCKATSGELIIPPYYYNKSVFQVAEPTFKSPDNLSLWSIHSKTIQKALVHIPNKLPQIADSSKTMKHLISQLHSHLNSVKTLQVATKHSFPWYMYFSITLGVLLIVSVLLIYCKWSGKLYALLRTCASKRAHHTTLTGHYNAANSSVSLHEAEQHSSDLTEESRNFVAASLDTHPKEVSQEPVESTVARERVKLY